MPTSLFEREVMVGLDAANSAVQSTQQLALDDNNLFPDHETRNALIEGADV